jgi:uncharacterized protein (TIGR02145 family)
MKNINRIIISPFLAFGLILLLVTSCKEEDTTSPVEELPLIATSYICDLSLNTAGCYGTITNTNGDSIVKKGVCWSGTNQNPTITDSVVLMGAGSESFKAIIKGLNKLTTYYARAFVTDTTDKTTYGDVLTFETLDTISDICGNVYRIKKFGSQVWMIDNLKTAKYRNGDSIACVLNDTIWSRGDVAAYSYYIAKTTNINRYGLLYNWAAISEERNIAPEGWHIPTDAEWETLINYLGGNLIAGGKMKGETDKVAWSFPNTGGTNESSFSGLPAGQRNYDATYSGIGTIGSWWAKSEFNASKSWSFSVGTNYKSITKLALDKGIGFSVRCVKD